MQGMRNIAWANEQPAYESLFENTSETEREELDKEEAKSDAKITQEPREESGKTELSITKDQVDHNEEVDWFEPQN